jgi:hypothetical protein
MADYDSSGAINIGPIQATAINIARSGITTTFTSGSTLTLTGVSVIGFTPSAAGLTTQLQYNNAGSLAGTTGLTWNAVTSTLTAPTLVLTTAGNAVQNVVGSLAAPSYTFATAPTTGFYYNTTANSPATTVGGTDRVITYHSKGSLTNSSANPVISLTLGAAANSRGGVMLAYTVEAADGVNSQSVSGWLALSASMIVAGGASPTANVTYDDTFSSSSGTLTAEWTTGVDADTVTLNVTPVSSLLTPTTLQVSYQVISTGGSAVLINIL